jgi:hypothetical protein
MKYVTPQTTLVAKSSPRTHTRGAGCAFKRRKKMYERKKKVLATNAHPAPRNDEARTVCVLAILVDMIKNDDFIRKPALD